MLAAVMSTFDSATAAIASSFVADVIRPVRELFIGPQVDAQTELQTEAGTEAEPAARTRRPPVLATVITGATLTVSGMVAAITYDPQNKLLVDFALGISSFRSVAC